MDCHWQPIATAPRDGSDVLLFSDGIGLAAGRFFTHEEAGCFSGWFGTCADGRVITDPSHWMPQPSSPDPVFEYRFSGLTAAGLRKLAQGLDEGIVECIPGDCTNTQDELTRLQAAQVLRALATKFPHDPTRTP